MLLHVLLLLGGSSAAATAATTSPTPPLEVFVDPALGDDRLLGASQGAALQSVRAAAARVRTLLAAQPGVDINVQLLPGTHHVGDGLTLGPTDGGTDGATVTWRSFDRSNPAAMGAPIHVTNWQPHPTVKNALSAPLPANITKGSTPAIAYYSRAIFEGVLVITGATLRQFWVIILVYKN